MTIYTYLGVNFVEAMRPTSKSTAAQSVTRSFLAWRQVDETIVNAAFALLLSLLFEGLPLDSVDCVPKGGGVWECTAKYAFTIPENPENNDDTEALGIAYAVDLSAGQVHITQSLETIATYATGVNLKVSATENTHVYPDTMSPSDADIGKTLTISGPSPPWIADTYEIIDVDVDAAGAYFWILDSVPAAVGTLGGQWSADTGPNYRQAIGVTKDTVAGTDIFAPKFEFSITVKTYPVTLDFLRTIAAATAKTNDAAWKGFTKNSVLYLGMTAQAQPDDFWTLTHKFAVGQNRTGLRVSPEITLDKKAWEYLWCAYGPASISGLVLNVPRVAKIERVYEETDFNLLRLNPPICDWTSTTPNGMHPLAVAFQDLSTGTPISWLWTFGDGTTSALKNPTKIYTNPGTYTVSLTVNNGAGTSFKTVTNYVTVS